MTFNPFITKGRERARCKDQYLNFLLYYSLVFFLIVNQIHYELKKMKMMFKILYMNLICKIYIKNMLMNIN